MSEPLFPWITAPQIPLAFLQHIPLLGDLIDPRDPPSIKPFGTLVAIGVYVGAGQVLRRARERGYDLKMVSDYLFWTVASGFVLSHVFDALTYHPQTVMQNPLYLLKIWDGLSSYGGFFGAIVGSLAWRWYRGQPILGYIDLTVSGMPLAWVFGRSGCSVVHDHPGILSDSMLAVRFPPPGVARSVEWVHWGPDYVGRFDLGLLELLCTIPIAIGVAVLWRRGGKDQPDGYFIGVICTAYPPVRFLLDFLRVGADSAVLGADPRYGGLTPAQWASFVLFALGAYHLYVVRKARREGRGPWRPEPVPADGPPSAAADGEPDEERDEPLSD